MAAGIVWFLSYLGMEGEEIVLQHSVTPLIHNACRSRSRGQALKHISLTARHSGEWSSLAKASRLPRMTIMMTVMRMMMMTSLPHYHRILDQGTSPAHLWRWPHLASTPQCVIARGVNKGTMFTLLIMSIPNGFTIDEIYLHILFPEWNGSRKRCFCRDNLKLRIPEIDYK